MQSLFILPFDHRGSFQKMIFPEKSELTEQDHAVIAKYKRVIFEAMKKVGSQRGHEKLGILVDEQYGADIHKEAKEIGIRNALTMEKSGQKIFDFEYEDWKERLISIKPTYAKALIRTVVGEDNTTQNARLKELGDFCEANNIGFLLEPLMHPSDEDLQMVGGDKKRFDTELRHIRFAEAVKEMHTAGIKPDVWKIEGTDTKEAMDACSQAVFDDGKASTQIVILGRGETAEKVAQWLQAGAKSKGVTGFAVGRTCFSKSIEALNKGEITQERAISQIAENYEKFIDIFEQAQKN